MHIFLLILVSLLLFLVESSVIQNDPNDFSSSEVQSYGHRMEYTYEMSPDTDSKPKVQMKYEKIGSPEEKLSVNDFRSFPPMVMRKNPSKLSYSENERPMQFGTQTFSGWLPFRDPLQGLHNNFPNMNIRKQEDKEEPSYAIQQEMEQFVRTQSEQLLNNLLEQFPAFPSQFEQLPSHYRTPRPFHYSHSNSRNIDRPTSWDLI